jgi:hypothetical protein
VLTMYEQQSSRFCSKSCVEARRRGPQRTNRLRRSWRRSCTCAHAIRKMPHVQKPIKNCWSSRPSELSTNICVDCSSQSAATGFALYSLTWFYQCRWEQKQPEATRYICEYWGRSTKLGKITIPCCVNSIVKNHACGLGTIQFLSQRV